MPRMPHIITPKEFTRRDLLRLASITIGCGALSKAADAAVLGARGVAMGGSGLMELHDTVLRVVIPSDSLSMSISMNLNGASVDWGDGTVDTLTSHTYEIGGDYVISIGKEATSINFGGNSKIVGCDNVGDSVTYFKFSSSPNLRYVHFGNGRSVTRVDEFCNRCYALEEVTMPIGGFTNRVNSNSYGLFYAQNLVSVDLSGFYINQCAGYSCECNELTSISYPSDYGATNTDCSQAFRDLKKVLSLVIPPNFGRMATDLTQCFYNCSTISELNLPSYFGDRATDVSWCFGGCSSLRELHLPSSFGCVATNVSSLFEGLNLDVTIPEGFAPGAVNAERMFRYSSTDAIFPDGFGGEITKMDYMFFGFNGHGSTARIRFPSGFGTKATSVPDNFFFGSGKALEIEAHYPIFNSNISNLGGYVVDHDSLVSLVNALSDQTSSTMKTLKIGSSNLSKLSSAEIAVATSKNWAVSA